MGTSKKSKATRWKPLKPFVVANHVKKSFGIYSKDDFLQLVHYERVRADRSEQEFSLVVFEIERVFRKESEIRAFVDTITSKVRAIDHVGWFENGIGVLLPLTSRTNAVKFARAIRQRAVTEVIPFAIYSYPDGSHTGSGLPGEEAELQDGAEEQSQHHAMKLYDASGAGRLMVSERLKSVFATGIPVWKRSLDIFGAFCGIVVLMPLFVALAAYIKLVSNGPVLYKSTRIGRKGESFTFLKFRTMHVDNDQRFHGANVKELIQQGGAWAKMDDYDPRIIPGGKLIRKLAVDELPQLLNILKGEMSLVGPRPCVPYEAEEYLRWHTRRFDIVPGLTGLWQVSGKDILSFQEMIRLDIEYSQRMSLWRDLYLIARTPLAIVGLVVRAMQRKVAPPESDAGQAAANA